MKRFFSLFAVTALFGFSATPTDATLYDRGSGLIYDSDLNITWLQDANFAKTTGYDLDGTMTWLQAMTWAANLTYYDSVRDITYDDWRLPATTNLSYPQYVFGYDGTTSAGYNISGSEMGHLYYTELGNKSYFDTSGIGPQPGWGLTYREPFINIQTSPYFRY